MISSVDGAPVWDVSEVVRMVGEREEGSKVRLGLLRGPYRGETGLGLSDRSRTRAYYQVLILVLMVFWIYWGARTEVRLI